MLPPKINIGRLLRYLFHPQIVGNDATSCVAPVGKILVLRLVPAALNLAGFSVVGFYSSLLLGCLLFM